MTRASWGPVPCMAAFGSMLQCWAIPPRMLSMHPCNQYMADRMGMPCMAVMRTMVHGMGRASLRQLALSRLGRELLAPPGGLGLIVRELKLVHLLFLVSIALLTILGLVVSAGYTSSLAWTLQWMQHAK